ncbi:LOW QUALITY PROTEIN: uncharacterized protein LOC125025732 [Penaeus chinensis]|uniref:LOW QUALITY PROTEIN: uncharacterized protein LOC125025732 n=1 Tax=Penaeus chinensis TaxID=139456 RepID=UPI001FB5A193|nr:LOW QUALITY PROTEIN: uncharacterized protein LOC125025732 [Penaeus chinensis]
MDITAEMKQWLSGITPEKKAKLVFFSSHAYTPCGKINPNVETTLNLLANAIALGNFNKIDDYLEEKVKAFSRHNVDKKEISEADYTCLSFFSACKYLNVVPPFLGLEKVSSIQDKFEMKDKERDYRFLLDSADLVLEKICDSLTLAGVAQIWSAMRKVEMLTKDVHNIDVIGFSCDLEPIGMKECLFFFIVRNMQMLKEINNVCTNRLERLIAECEENSACEEGKTLRSIIEGLRCYPVEGYPFGFCLILSVHHNRDGAKKEFQNVLTVSKYLGMISYEIKDPKEKTIEEMENELKKPKYRFYSSFTCWFMSHGDKKSIELADGKTIERESFLTKFSDIDSFKLKPKVFFMVSCLGKKKFRLEADDSESLSTTEDQYAITSIKVREEFSDTPVRGRNISDTQPMMDTLVAYSTMPDNLSGRNITHGSIYVNRACMLMSENISRGKNLTEILEHISQELHEIVQEKEEEDCLYKQGCHYHSYFRKTLKLPHERNND